MDGSREFLLLSLKIFIWKHTWLLAKFNEKTTRDVLLLILCKMKKEKIISENIRNYLRTFFLKMC